MALQSERLAMAALGVRDDRPPNALQPPLIDGIHLRWAFTRALGFPWYGFYLFRRPHRPGTAVCLSQVTGTLPTGPWPSPTLDTPQGQLSSDQNLVLTDDFAPPSAVEFDLHGRSHLRFRFPEASPARRAEVRVGFRARPGDPPPTRTCIDFTGQRPGPGPNPRPEAGVVLEARNEVGERMPNTRVRQMEGAAGKLTGLDCGFGLLVTLLQPATFVEAVLTHFVKPAVLEAFNQDGSSAGTVAMQKPRGREPETLRVFGTAITRVVVHADQDETLLNEFCFGTGHIAAIDVTGLSGDAPVARTAVRGYAGQVSSAVVEADSLSALELSSGPAALVEVCAVPLVQEATVGWETIRDFEYPMALPVTSPDYPCTPGTPEDFERARKLAARRIHYGDGRAFTAVPPPSPATGTVSVSTGSPLVLGAGTSWGAGLVGSTFQVRDDPTAYTVTTVVGAEKLSLDRPFAAASRSGAGYSISADRFGQIYSDAMDLVVGGPAGGPMVDRVAPEPAAKEGAVSVTNGSTTVSGTGTAWGPELAGLMLQVAGEVGVHAIQRVDSPTALTLRASYVGATATGRSYAIVARSQADASGGIVPSTPTQRPLDTALLGSIHPAVAEVLGLAWVDRQADPGTAYDYLIVADRTNVAGGDPAKMLGVLAQEGFATVDGHIVHNRRAGPSPPLSAPTGLRVYALPEGVKPSASGGSAVGNGVGLRWDAGTAGAGVLLPTAPVLFHVWRADLGNAPAPAPPGRYDPVAPDRPVLALAAPPPPPAPRPGWPPFPLNALDPALADGWYGYQVSGIDIFGRHSPNGPAGPWHQWAPVPEPRPWYYQDPPGDRAIHPSAVQLRVTAPPPSPTGVGAYALDPADPTVVKDAAFTAWWNALTASAWYQALTADQRRNLIGLRVRWLWTASLAQQAPSTREFRLYFRPGHFNALASRVVAVSPVSATETDVQVTLAGTQPADSFNGAALTVEGDAFPIVGSSPGTRLTLRVRNLGRERTIRPRLGADSAVTVPVRYARGRATVTSGSAAVSGSGTDWHAALVGGAFVMVGEEDTGAYRVASVASATSLTLDRPYAGPAASERGYGITHPLFVDPSRPTNWDARIHVTGFDEAVTVTTDAAGRPLRRYEVFLPVPSGTVHGGLPLTPSRAAPVVYAQIGVTAADDRPYTPDDPKWGAGPWGARPGNEGRVGPRATVFRILREPPPPPVLPPYPEALHASGPDAQNRCFATFRWQLAPDVDTQVTRALDDTVFQVDWERRPDTPLDPNRLELFPGGGGDPRWDAAKRAEVAAQIDQLNGFPRDPASRALAMAHYASMSNDALRVLAGLPGNEGAFTPITAVPLDPGDPDIVDRRNPDDPDTYVPNPGLRAYLDTLAAGPADRYFYRAAHVDAAHNRSDLSLSSPPVWLPDIVPPERPLLLEAAGATGSVVLRWEANVEPDLDHYRLYRADAADDGRDLRTMTLVTHIAKSPTATPRPGERLPAAAPNSTGRRLEVSDTVAGNAPHHYRLVAVDGAGNVSPPSQIVSGRAIHPPPAPPVLAPPTWDTDHRLVTLAWTAGQPGLQSLVERRAAGGGLWLRATDWLAAGAYGHTDEPPDPQGSFTYRVRVRDALRQVSRPSAPEATP